MPVKLTAREKEILVMVLNEQSSAAIASQLELSVRTVETHRKNIYRKTDTFNLVGLTKYAIRKGMLDGYCFTSTLIQTNSVPLVRSLQLTGS